MSTQSLILKSTRLHKMCNHFSPTEKAVNLYEPETGQEQHFLVEFHPAFPRKSIGSFDPMLPVTKIILC